MSDLWGIGYLIYSSNSGQGFSHLIFMEFKGKDLCITACGQHGHYTKLWDLTALMIYFNNQTCILLWCLFNFGIRLYYDLHKTSC